MFLNNLKNKFLIKYKKINQKKNIHIIGDSHALYGWNNIKNIELNIHHLGPILCYSIGKYGLQRLNFLNLNIKNNDIIILSFGEIDCRCHIKKYCKTDTDYMDIIDNIIDKYFDTIRLNVNFFKNLIICIYCILPPTELTEHKIRYDWYGTNEERKKYVNYFNIKLFELCLKSNYIFFNVYEFYKDSNGYLNLDLSDGEIHIENSYHLENYLIKILNKINYFNS